MKLCEIMNATRTDVTSSLCISQDASIYHLDAEQLRGSREEYVKVIDDQGACVGTVKREKLVYVSSKYGSLDFWPVEILDNLEVGVIAVDPEGRIFFVNRAYGKILGLHIGKIFARNLHQIEPGTALSRVLRERKPMTSPRQLIKTVNKYVSTKMYPMFRDGEFAGAFSIFSDDTELNDLDREVQHISRVAEHYRQQLRTEDLLRDQHIIGNSPAFLNSVKRTIAAAKTDAVVLLRGENGAGKEIFARLLRDNSGRKDKPFITVNCSAIPENLLESELFGYEEGAFTGAKRGGSLGKFQLAEGGTLLLDEIGDLPMAMQAKLLRVLQEGEIEKLGRQKNLPVNVRVVAATNQPLEEMMKEGHFRMDLYYRLNVISIQVPPLRERGTDILLLANHFLTIYNQKYGKHLKLDKDVYQQFLSYSWPGNVRELQNVIESAVVLCDGTYISLADLPAQFRPQHGPAEYAQLEEGTLEEKVALYERSVILSTLNYFGGNRKKTIEALGLSRRTFYRKMKELDIQD